MNHRRRIGDGGTMHAIQLPKRLNGSGLARPTYVAVVAGSIVINDTGSGYVYYSVPYPLSQEKRTLFRMGDDGQPVYKDDGLTVETYEEDSELCVFEDSYGVVQYFNGESSSDRVCAVYAVGSALYLFGPKSVDTWESFSSGLANSTERWSFRFPGLCSRRSPRHGLTRVAGRKLGIR